MLQSQEEDGLDISGKFSAIQKDYGNQTDPMAFKRI